MKKYKLYQVDSFTKEKFKGNPAGVVSNAKGLSKEQMQKIAREMNNSETAFIFPPTSNDHDVHVRFFTPTTEVPICGHATIAAHYVRAIEHEFGNKTVVQKTGAGNLPVEIIKQDNDYKIIMTQGNIEFGDLTKGKSKQTLLSALHLNIDELEPKCPIQIVSTGHSKVMIGIKSRKKLDQLKPNLDTLSSLSKNIGCNGYFIFTFDSDEPSILTHCRMFAPAIGIDEDPVTGNANGPLGAYLVYNKLVRHDGCEFQFKSKQGEAIGRTGSVDVNVKIENGKPIEVKIIGEAVVVFKTEIEI